jgi:hypothetical protein
MQTKSEQEINKIIEKRNKLFHKKNRSREEDIELQKLEDIIGECMMQDLLPTIKRYSVLIQKQEELREDLSDFILEIQDLKSKVVDG